MLLPFIVISEEEILITRKNTCSSSTEINAIKDEIKRNLMFLLVK